MVFTHVLSRYAGLSLTRTMATHSTATVTRLSKHLELHKYHPDKLGTGEPRPTLVFLPWMTATQSLANRYREVYAARGFNVLTVWGSLSYFLWPQWAMPLATELADYLDQQTEGPVIVHSMSVGSYLYAVTLTVLADNPKYGGLVSRVKGHVYDSVVIGTLEEMARGVGMIVVPKSAILQTVVTRASLLYFAATKKQTVVPYNRFIDVVHNPPMKTPMLCFYSRSDVLCLPEAFERLINHWKDKHRLDVTSKVWEKSPHAAHLRTDPETYHRVLDEYLKKLDLGDISPQFNSKL